MATIKFPLYFFILSAFIISSTLCISKNSLNPTNYDTLSNELVNQVCKNTSNFQFCQETIYADPQAPEADRYVLAYITFRKAYQNATSTSKHIVALIKNMTNNMGHEKIIQLGSLKECNGYYNEALKVLGQALNDLNSETFDGLGDYAVSAGNNARKCEPLLKDDEILSKKNQDLIKLSEICNVVSKLYDSDYGSLI
ncbi:hypothetical protein Leryth_003402 [Lithospermum erythrorhizon]|nr:hypothetical protein Leryth_003402 [Lithospermum erythrorhizon]